MNIIDLFESDIIELPKSYLDCNYRNFIKIIFNDYINSVNTLEISDYSSKILKNNSDKIRLNGTK